MALWAVQSVADSVAMTDRQLAAEPAASYTEAQLAGEACTSCGTDGLPLHLGETIELRVDDGVVRDLTTAFCTPCLLSGR